LLQQVINNRWFTVVNLLLVVVCGIIWILIPEFGLFFTLLALLPNGLRLLAGRPPFQRTPFDWFMAIFLITTWVGYWAAYDKTTAWIKFWLIITAVLLYYALSDQPSKNLGLLSFISFCFGLGISVYFFLTNDFVANEGRVVSWWVTNRPHIDLPVIHHGYISGLLAITSIFAFYWLWGIRKRSFGQLNIVIILIIALTIGVVAWAFIITMSRGIWAAVAGGLGVWLLWKVTSLNGFLKGSRMNSLFPILTLAFLGMIIVYVYLGPARAVGDSAQSTYGRNSRAELSERGSYFLADYPITGGGLNSFPGLYSQYMISIPFFYFANTYNMFLDISIEQGLIAGLVVIFIYLGSIWYASQTIIKSKSQQIRLIGWLGLFTLVVTVIHGLFYDYLYNGSGTMFLLFPIGISMIGILNINESGDETNQISVTSFSSKNSYFRKFVYILIFGIAVLAAFNTGKIRSIWYANLGAVQMSQTELKNFPTNEWIGIEIVPALEPAEITLLHALQYDPVNPGVNYRLGLISMLRQDYESAVVYLETAHTRMPNHRGIIKSLGYNYVWLGDMKKAHPFLVQIPEAGEELDVYTWWWGTHGRNDLSMNASLALETLDTVFP
jgi:hypothetical protein